MRAHIIRPKDGHRIATFILVNGKVVAEPGAEEWLTLAVPTDNGLVTAEQAPEAWLRNLPRAFRGGYAGALFEE